jgi:glycerol dehydrogenase-like iron-containing ADH family enzyme
MIALRDGTPHDLHGRQVGIGTILACAVYERLLALESPRFSHAESIADAAYWGALINQVEAEFSQKQDRMRVAAQSLGRGNAWDRLREALRKLVRPPGQIRDCLKRAGAACSARDIGCSPEQLTKAFVHAREMRSRFCVFDLATLAGILPSAAEELVEQWC